MPKPQEYTDTLILTKKLFLVGFRGLQSMSKPIERPCIYCEVRQRWNIWKPDGNLWQVPGFLFSENFVDKKKAVSGYKLKDH